MRRDVMGELILLKLELEAKEYDKAMQSINDLIKFLISKKNPKNVYEQPASPQLQ